MKKLTGLLLFIGIFSMALSGTTINLTLSGEVDPDSPGITLSEGTFAISAVVGEPISSTVIKTMTLTAPDEESAADQVTVALTTTTNNWRGISGLTVSSTSPNFSENFPTDGTSTALTQTFSATTAGTAYTLTFGVQNGATALSVGSFAETLYVSALYNA